MKSKNLVLILALFSMVFGATMGMLLNEGQEAEGIIDVTYGLDEQIVIRLDLSVDAGHLARNWRVRNATGANNTVQIRVEHPTGVTDPWIEEGPYTIDIVDIYWGDGGFNTTTIPGVPDFTLKHNYTETGTYTITVKAGDVSWKKYNVNTTTITIWNRTIEGRIVDEDNNWLGPNFPLTKYTLTGSAVGINATNKVTAQNGFLYGITEITTLTMGSNLNYTYTIWANNGGAWVLGWGLIGDQPDTSKAWGTRAQLQTDYNDINYNALPVYTALDESYASTVNLTASSAYNMVLEPVSQNDDNLTNTFPQWTSKRANAEYTWTKNIAYFRMYIEVVMANAYPALFTYDSEITASEYNSFVLYADMLISVMLGTMNRTFPPTSEQYFFLDGKIFDLDLDSIVIESFDGLIGGYRYNATSGEVEEIGNVSQLTLNIGLDLENDDIDTTLTKHTARWKLLVESYNNSNRSYIIKCPSGWTITDFSRTLYAVTTFDEPNQTLTYKSVEVNDATQFPEEWIEIEMTQTPGPEPPEPPEPPAEPVPEQKDLGELFWDWFVANWYWVVGSVAVAVIVSVLWMRRK